MKKLLLTILTGFLILNAQSQLFEEHFETWPLDNWSIYNQGASTPGWASSNLNAYDGALAAYHTYNSTQSCDGWLVSPQITSLPANSRLIFYERNSLMTYYGYSGVLISTVSGDPADGDFVEIYESSSSSPSYSMSNIDLSTYAGQDVYIAFNYTGTNAHSWYIDNVAVFEEFTDDASVSISADSLQINDSIHFTVVVKNYGTNTLATGAAINIQLDGGNVVTLNTTTDLNQFETEEIETGFLSDPGNFILSAALGSDDNLSNNTSEISVQVYHKSSQILNFESNTYLNWTFDHTAKTSMHEYEGYYAANKSSWYTVGTITSAQLDFVEGSLVNFYALGNDEGEQISIAYLDPADEIWKTIGDTIDIAVGWNNYTLDLATVEGLQTQLRISLINAATSSYPYIDNVILPGFTQVVPGNVTSVSPEDQTTNLDLWDDYILWEKPDEAIFIDGYKLYFGTDGEGTQTPTNMVNGTVTNGTTYYIGDFDYDSTYYFQIVPFNSVGDAEDCPIYEISIMSKVYLTPPVSFDFNDEERPADWRDYTGQLTSNTTLSRSSSSQFYFEYFNNDWDSTSALKVNLYTNKHVYSVLPDIVLGDTLHQYTFEFDASITSWASSTIDTMDLDDTLAVVISTDGIWSQENVLLNITHEDSLGYGTHYSIDLDGYSDTIQLAFYATSTTSTKDNDIFIDNVAINMVSEDASLEEIRANDVLIDGFDPEVFEYVYEYVAGTTQVPAITAVATDPLADVQIVAAADLQDTTVITVTAQNGNFVSEYIVTFEERVASTDASLTSLLVNGTAIASFDPEVLDYEFELPAGTTSIPVVTAVLADENASLDVTQAADVNGIATIGVTAEDEQTIRTYSIDFIVLNELGIPEITLADVTLYPNPVSEVLYLSKEIEKIEVLDVTGSIVFEGSNLNHCDMSDFHAGYYIVRLTQHGNTAIHRVVKE